MLPTHLNLSTDKINVLRFSEILVREKETQEGYRFDLNGAIKKTNLTNEEVSQLLDSYQVEEGTIEELLENHQEEYINIDTHGFVMDCQSGENWLTELVGNELLHHAELIPVIGCEFDYQLEITDIEG